MRLLALDLHERSERLRAVREEEIAVGRVRPGRPDGDQGERHPHGHEPKRLHSRLRVRPPSTPIVIPETYPPQSDARKQTTSPTSRVVPSRLSGIVARSDSVGPAGYTSLIRSVSMRPGA